MNNQHNLHFFDRFNQWLRESVTVKLASIGLLVLVLLIPAVWVLALMEERQERAESVIAEVSNKWSGAQILAGPALALPYLENETIYNADGKLETRQVKHIAYFLPEELDVKTVLKPRYLHRGIFDVVVYEANVVIDATFQKPDFGFLKIKPAKLLWEEAFLMMGISDLRGLSKEAPSIHTGNTSLTSESSQDIPFIVHSSQNKMTGIRIPLNWPDEKSFEPNTNMMFNLKGSGNLRFVPSAKTTVVNLSGSWTSPSFDGAFLPESRNVSDSAFTAFWKVLHFNRPVPQQWTDKPQDFYGSDFGVSLLVPADQYQKSIRTAKYSVLIILFTFIALFFLEITQHIRIHPVQYILIGSGLIIYYILLLSLSEQTGFNVAYGIASAATIALITAYASTFLKKQTFLLASLLLVFYGFIFFITLLEDYALLTGSIGLFTVVAALMYASRKINWYSI